MFQHGNLSRKRIKPLEEAREYVAKNVDKDCVEKQFIDDTIGKIVLSDFVFV